MNVIITCYIHQPLITNGENYQNDSQLEELDFKNMIHPIFDLNIVKKAIIHTLYINQ